MDIIEMLKQCAIEIQGILYKSDSTKEGQTNTTGDEQLKIDVCADQLIAKRLAQCSSIKAIASEEQKDIQHINPKGQYCVAYDPLDGSSVLESNFTIGSIFGVYNNAFEAKNLVMSAYILYGFNVEMVIAHEIVEHFRLCGGSFIKLGNLSLGKKGMINATGGTQKDWNEEHRRLMESFFADGYRLRYSGAMVSDLHQILKKGGGIFSYPATQKNPHGKLRLLFELLPFAFIFEKAGGYAIDGVKRLLECSIDSPHAISPCYFGSFEEIQRVQQTNKG